MSLDDPIQHPADPRCIVGQVIVGTSGDPKPIELFTMSMNTHDVDPEFRHPYSFMEYLLEATETGSRALLSLRQYAKDVEDRVSNLDDLWCEFYLDGECLQDGPASEALEDHQHWLNRETRMILNP